MEIIEIRKGQFLTIDKLCDILGLSKFKVTNYIEELNAELTGMNEEKFITIEVDGELNYGEITTEIIRHQKLAFLMDSKVFLLFDSLVQRTTHIEKFAETNFISISKAYEVRKELKKIMKSKDLKIKNGILEGNEFDVRNLVFEVYYYFFNGIQYPFDRQVKKMSQHLIKILVANFHIRLTPTKKIKLELFLSIQYLRISQRKMIHIDYINEEKLVDPIFKMSALRENLFGEQLSKEKDIKAELSFLYFFLTTQDIIETEIIYLDDTLQEKITAITDAFIKVTENHLTFKQEISLSNQQDIYKQLAKELNKVNKKMMAFQTMATTFISEDQVAFFKENYPAFHELITDMMGSSSFFTNFSNTEKTKIYYDYMFLMIATIPLNSIEEPIYVCVDFSHGAHYSTFIASNIDSFKNLNIKIERSLSSRTNLYMSDFLIKNIPCEQIIWKNPPSAADWEIFADVVLKIKGDKYE